MRIHSSLFCSFVSVCLVACSGGPARKGPTDRISGLAVSPPAEPAPLSAELQGLIERGRVLLDEERALEAEELFARAAEADGGSLRTRMWVLRAWMDQGRSDETLAELEVLEHSGATGPAMAYLYGMAFARRAEGLVASGSTDSSVEMCFIDATSYLEEALVDGGESYPDALPALARSAWSTQQLEIARSAADRAVELDKKDPEGWLLRGRIALAQYASVASGSAANDATAALWDDAKSSFERAIALHGKPATDTGAHGLAAAARELGNAHLWKQDFAAAGDAFALAIAWAPESFDYAGARELLASAPLGFRGVLEAARARFESRAGTDDPRAGALLWWLGWARFGQADWAGAEEAFLASLERGPEFTNAWFYVGLARAYAKDPEGALAAMHAGWDVDQATMVGAARNAPGGLPGFEGLIGWCASQEPARNLEAAFLADLLAQAFPDEPRHWNNLGLFLRDEGERLEIDAYQEKAPEPDPALLSDLYERSFAAYQRALELQPDDPQLLNDTTLMLHYHVGGNLEEVKAMYERSIALSEERLAAADLSPDDRARFEQTKSDANENLERLLEPDAENPAQGAAAPASVSPQDP